jgi:hypothetical protein
MLPVKTPKVPTAANKKDKENSGGENSVNSSDKKNQNSLTKTGNCIDKDKDEKSKQKPPLTGKEIQSTKISNKFLSRMKR